MVPASAFAAHCPRQGRESRVTDMGVRDYYKRRWAADRFSGRRWFAYSAFYVFLAVLCLTVLNSPAQRYGLSPILLVIAVICGVQGNRSHHR
jgi:hypothetical protein